jgi:hypothetical protein
MAPSSNEHETISPVGPTSLLGACKRSRTKSPVIGQQPAALVDGHPIFLLNVGNDRRCKHSSGDIVTKRCPKSYRMKVWLINSLGGSAYLHRGIRGALMLSANTAVDLVH